MLNEVAEEVFQPRRRDPYAGIKRIVDATPPVDPKLKPSPGLKNPGTNRKIGLKRSQPWSPDTDMSDEDIANLRAGQPMGSKVLHRLTKRRDPGPIKSLQDFGRQVADTSYKGMQAGTGPVAFSGRKPTPAAAPGGPGTPAAPTAPKKAPASQRTKSRDSFDPQDRLARKSKFKE
jgi:hypothetical protein